MKPFRYRHPWLLRIALVAALCLAGVPTLSRVMIPATGSGPWSEICSTAGARQLVPAVIPSDPSDFAPASGQSRSARMKPCPLWAHANPVLGPPPLQLALVPLVDVAAHVPALYSHAPPPLYVWAPVQARAPPSSERPVVG